MSPNWKSTSEQDDGGNVTANELSTVMEMERDKDILAVKL